MCRGTRASERGRGEDARLPFSAAAATLRLPHARVCAREVACAAVPPHGPAHGTVGRWQAKIAPNQPKDAHGPQVTKQSRLRG